jgi:hypothetical protein
MTGLDWIVAPVALVVFALYLAVIPWFVPKPDLITVIVVVIVMAAYDFFRTARRSNSRNRNRPPN